MIKECFVSLMLMLSSIDRAVEVFTLEPIIRFITRAGRRDWTWRKRGLRVGRNKCGMCLQSWSDSRLLMCHTVMVRTTGTFTIMTKAPHRKHIYCINQTTIGDLPEIGHIVAFVTAYSFLFSSDSKC